MRSFFYRWFWEGRQKWLILFSFVSFCLWVGAYASWEILGKGTCPNRETFAPITQEYQKCVDLYLFTIYNPFFSGFILKSMILAPLLVLFASMLAARVWALLSLFFIPFGILAIVNAPTYAMFITKVSVSQIVGILYILGTLAIVLLVPLGEWLYKKYKVKK